MKRKSLLKFINCSCLILSFSITSVPTNHNLFIPDERNHYSRFFPFSLSLFSFFLSFVGSLVRFSFFFNSPPALSIFCKREIIILSSFAPLPKRLETLKQDSRYTEKKEKHKFNQILRSVIMSRVSTWKRKFSMFFPFGKRNKHVRF